MIVNDLPKQSGVTKDDIEKAEEIIRDLATVDMAAIKEHNESGRNRVNINLDFASTTLIYLAKYIYKEKLDRKLEIDNWR